MVQLTQSQFTSAIESIRVQMTHDREYSNSLEVLFNAEQIGLYDNSKLIRTIISLLQIWFPKVEDFCAVSHFCFDLDFGRFGDEELLTIDDLWFELNKCKNG